MGNCELLHHPSVLVCFVAESWSDSPPPSLPLRLHPTPFLRHTDFALFYSVMTKHAKVKLDYITGARPAQRALFMFLLRSSSPPGRKSQEDRHLALRRLSCITSSYLGQWCMLTSHAHCHDAESSDANTDSSEIYT